MQHEKSFNEDDGKQLDNDTNVEAAGGGSHSDAVTSDEHVQKDGNSLKNPQTIGMVIIFAIALGILIVALLGLQ